MSRPGELTRAVAAAYDAAAEAFGASADPFVYRLLASPLANAVSEVMDPSRGAVLDVACGTGALGRSFPESVGVDVAVRLLAANGSTARVAGDAEDLPFRDDSFAAAVSSFGINHYQDPARTVREMARVAPVVGVSTWARPEREYRPKRSVHDALDRQTGRHRSALGDLLDPLNDQVGTVDAVDRLLAGAGLRPAVSVVEIEVPWPGLDRYLDYRLSMPTTAMPLDRSALAQEVRLALEHLDGQDLTWHALVIVGVGRRPSTCSPGRKKAAERPLRHEGATQLRR